MLKYVAISSAAKAFSLNAATQQAYRKLGNIALEKMRVSGGVTEPYFDRAVRLVDTCDRLSVLEPGSRVLELGTGWVHWESTILRLFFDIEVTLYDVVDNRLLGAYQTWLRQLDDKIDEIFAHLPARRRERAHELVTACKYAQTFDELYAAMGFRYLLDPSGELKGVEQDAYQLIVSADVLEHVPAEALPTYLPTALSCLKPGGWSIHQIDLVDHFHYFDTTMSKKHYYRYSDEAWVRWFESDVQYFNRVQRPTWMALFDKAGFETIEEDHLSEGLEPLRLSDQYRDLTPADLECMQLLTVHRRPA